MILCVLNLQKKALLVVTWLPLCVSFGIFPEGSGSNGMGQVTPVPVEFQIIGPSPLLPFLG